MRGTIVFKALIAGILIALVTNAQAQTPAPAAEPPPLSPVIWTENPDVVQRFGVTDDRTVKQMVNSSLLKLTSASDIGTAWTRLGIVPQDVVGIKIATKGGTLLSSHRPIVQAICDGLQAAGVSPSHIIIWDKDAGDMRRAGYAPSPAADSHVAIASVFPGVGYDSDVFYKNEMIGKLIWGDFEFRRSETDDDPLEAARNAVRNKAYNDGTVPMPAMPDDSLNGLDPIPQSSTQSHYAKFLTSLCTKIVNVPVLVDNPAVGIEGCLGSLALAGVDNNRRFQGDPTFGDPAICEILSKDFIRHKVVVNILDALVSQYAGGPRFDPQFTKSIGAIYTSRDPVAVDYLVLHRLEEWRATDRNGRIDPIGKAASHVHSAASYNLGTDDPSRIQLVRIP